MEYGEVLPGIFLERPNRFLAHVNVNGRIEICHVKNTGRCKELLIPGARVFVEQSKNINRKTKYDLIAVNKGTILMNIDSQAPNIVVGEWLKQNGLEGKLNQVKAEQKFGDSRMDFYFERAASKGYIEVKGVTLEKNKIASFPDAPTERGIKHIRHLIHAVEQGFEAYLIFVIQFQPVRFFVPNDEMHFAFGEILREAKHKGVRILAYDSFVTERSMELGAPVLVRLDGDLELLDE